MQSLDGELSRRGDRASLITIDGCDWLGQDPGDTALAFQPMRRFAEFVDLAVGLRDLCQGGLCEPRGDGPACGP